MSEHYQRISNVLQTTVCVKCCKALSAGQVTFFTLWLQACGCDTTKASITQPRWENETGSSITGERRGTRNWQLSPLVCRRLKRLSEITMQSWPCCQAFNDTLICWGHLCRGLFFTLLLTSIPSYQQTSSFSKGIMFGCFFFGHLKINYYELWPVGLGYVIPFTVIPV